MKTKFEQVIPLLKDTHLPELNAMVAKFNNQLFGYNQSSKLSINDINIPDIFSNIIGIERRISFQNNLMREIAFFCLEVGDVVHVTTYSPFSIKSKTVRSSDHILYRGVNHIKLVILDIDNTNMVVSAYLDDIYKCVNISFKGFNLYGFVERYVAESLDKYVNDMAVKLAYKGNSDYVINFSPPGNSVELPNNNVLTGGTEFETYHF